MIIGLTVSGLTHGGIINFFSGRPRSWTDTCFFIGIFLVILGFLAMVGGKPRMAVPYGGSERSKGYGGELRDVSSEETAEEFKKQHMFSFSPLSLFFLVAGVIATAAGIIFS